MPSILADAPTSIGNGLLNYGLAGLIVATFVIPLALYIKKMWERQLEQREAEIVRLREENADLRRVLDPIVPALARVGEVMNMAMSIISNRSSGP